MGNIAVASTQNPANAPYSAAPMPAAGPVIKYWFGQVNPSTSYATGGDALVPGTFGLAAIYGGVGGTSTDGTLVSAVTVASPTTATLKTFATAAAPVVETAATTNNSAKAIPIVLWGV